MRDLLGEEFHDPVRDSLLAGKAVSGKVATGAVSRLAPGIAEEGLSQGARTAIGAAGAGIVGGALIAYDVHTAKPEEKKWVLGRESASTAATIAIGVVAGGFLLPAAAGLAVTGTGFLIENGIKNSTLEDAHAAAMNNIKPDFALSGNSNLQQVADMMDKAVQAGKAARIKSGLAVPPGDFVRDASGHVDIHNADNQKNLNDFIATQREQTTNGMADLEQLSVLPAAFKSGDKEKALFALEEAQKKLDVAKQELTTSLIQNSTPITSRDAQQKEMAELKKKGVEVSYSEHIYTLKPNNISTFNKSSASSPEVIPPEVWAIHKARNDDNPVSVLYKSKDGKSAEMMTFVIRDGKPITMDVSDLYSPLPTPKVNTKHQAAQHHGG